MFDCNKHPTLSYAHDWSADTLLKMQQCLSSLDDHTSDLLVTIAVSGSLGRLEGMQHSDCDLIVLVNDDVIKDDLCCRKIMQSVWDALTPLGLPLPKANGIYATPASPRQICDYHTLGLIEDDKNTFGKRMQILLDTRSVYKEENFHTLVRDLLKRYATGFLIYDQKKEWVYLLNDLIRYFRSYCAWHQFDLTNEPTDNWYMRNLKLRNSRILMFAALILLIGECSKEKDDKIGWLYRYISLTPLQRIERVYELNQDNNFAVLLDAYELFMARMRSPTVRKDLLKANPGSLQELSMMRPDSYQELHSNSDRVIGELTRFLLQRKDNWSQAFFEYLLF